MNVALRSQVVDMLTRGERVPFRRALAIVSDCRELLTDVRETLLSCPQVFPAFFLFQEPLRCSDYQVVLGPKDSDPQFREWDHFIPPEYTLHGRIDERSIVFALGVLTYKLIVGNEYFRAKLTEDGGFLTRLFGGGLYAILQSSLKVKLVPISKVVGDCPSSVQDVVYCALQDDPNRRQQSIDKFYHDITNPLLLKSPR